jgi:hypothetical protein
MMVPRDKRPEFIDVLSAMDDEPIGRMDAFDDIDV